MKVGRPTNKPTKEWMIDHYVNKKMTVREIAFYLSSSNKSVSNWINEFGIQSRKSKHSYEL